MQKFYVGDLLQASIFLCRPPAHTQQWQSINTQFNVLSNFQRLIIFSCNYFCIIDVMMMLVVVGHTSIHQEIIPAASLFNKLKQNNPQII